MYIGLHVKYPSFLSDFNEAWILSTDFPKILNLISHENSFRGTQFAPCGRTDMTKQIFALVGRDSSVVITTRYGLDVPGIGSRWGRYFPHPSRPALRPTQSCTMGTGSFLGVKRSVRGVDHPPTSSAEVKEKVELCICFPLWAFVAWIVAFSNSVNAPKTGAPNRNRLQIVSCLTECNRQVTC
jgi:hypothetical protein